MSGFSLMAAAYAIDDSCTAHLSLSSADDLDDLELSDLDEVSHVTSDLEWWPGENILLEAFFRRVSLAFNLSLSLLLKRFVCALLLC